MEERIDYQVLAPDSVAWFIQAALVADRQGNEHTRDLALAEAQRIAQERRLVQQAQEPCYDCRTNQQRIVDLEQRVKGLTTALGACASSATVHSQGERLDAWLSSVRNLDSRVAYLERKAQGITGQDAGL